jgi:hypothetical protein
LIPDPDGHDISMVVASGGHLHVLEWALINEIAAWDDDDMSNATVAAKNGHLHVLQFAQSSDYPMRGQVFL